MGACTSICQRRTSSTDELNASMGSIGPALAPWLVPDLLVGSAPWGSCSRRAVFCQANGAMVKALAIAHLLASLHSFKLIASLHSFMHASFKWLRWHGARTALCRADRARDTPLRSQRSSRAAEPGSFSYQACDTPEPYTGVAGPRSSCWSSMLTPEATSVRTALRAASASASANFPCSSAKRSSFPAIIIGLLSDPMAISGSGTGHNRFRGNS